MTTSISNGDSGSSIRTKLNDIWEGLTINEISASKAETAVDVFVYDTSKDSDGGAWRKRTQHTSWYNEPLNTATRGSRKEFPAVAVIVAQSDGITIYDGDDPDMPMWKDIPAGFDYVFNTAGGGAVTATQMLNGELVGVTSTRGISLINFIKDTAAMGVGNTTRELLADIATVTQGNAVFSAYAKSTGIYAFPNQAMNDVAITVLPDAPIDPATGLPIPTIAVATDGGVSVIKDDGTVVNLVNYVTAPPAVSFVDVGGVTKLHTTSRYSNWINVFDIPDADFNAGNYIWSVDFPANGYASEFSETKTSLVSGWSKSLVQFQKDEALTNINGVSTANRGVQIVNHITSTYNTGWMNGDIKGAFLSSTDATSLVGSGELVTNGTFDTDTSGWSADNANLSSVSGEFVVENSTAAFGRGYQAITTVAGKTYVIQVDRIGGTSSNYDIQVRDGSIGGTILLNSGALTSTGTQVFSFIAQSSTSVVRVGNATSTSGLTGIFDNISVKLADADRSVNNKGLIVNGTITRTYVDEV